MSPAGNDLDGSRIGLPMSDWLDAGRGIVLGPMSGYTSRSYREFMLGFGARVAVTEMVSAPGLVHNPDESAGYVRAVPGQVTGVQVFGSDPDTVAEGASVALGLEPDLAFVDINMGCPAGKVMRTGAGSSLMSDPELCGRIVRRVVDAVGVPVTIKTRLGLDTHTVNFRRVVDECVRAGADAVTVHTRTADQRYAGCARHEEMAGYGGELPVPLIVSGDIRTADDAVEAMRVTGAEAVMVARGGVGNPFLVTQIAEALAGREVPPDPTPAQQAEWCVRLIDMTEAEFGEEVALAKMRGVAAKFLSGFRYSREYRRAVTMRCGTLDEVRQVVLRAGGELEGRRSPGDGWERPPITDISTHRR